MLLLSVAIALATRFSSAQSTGQDAENVSFEERSPGAAGAATSAGNGALPGVRAAPVSPQGDFTHEIPIDVPPGRSGMTPDLVLRYTSAGARRDSAYGAGWSLAVPFVSRGTLDGFPPLTPDAAGALRYDDLQTSFEGPDGELVAATAAVVVPAGRTGKFYVPLREHTPVRYELLPTTQGGIWVRHEPGGKKQFFGGVEGSNSGDARVATALGTAIWLLVREVDPNGNIIDYEWLGPDEPDLPGALRPVPVLRQVKWGASERLGQAHVFTATFDTSPVSGGAIEMMPAPMTLTRRVDAVRVAGPDGEHWAYRLRFTTSADSGRFLLDGVERAAPGEQPLSWTFGYSRNLAPVSFEDRGALGKSCSPGEAIPPGALFYAQRLAKPAPATLADAVTPLFLRSAHKLGDFDGDGMLDVLYHPAGIQTTASRVVSAASHRGSVTGFQSPFSLNGIPDQLITEIADLDDDGDADALAFQTSLALQKDKRLQDLGVSGFTFGGSSGGAGDVCCDGGFWAGCGNIDPVPIELPPPGTVVPEVDFAAIAPKLRPILTELDARRGGQSIGLFPILPKTGKKVGRILCIDQVKECFSGPMSCATLENLCAAGYINDKGICIIPGTAGEHTEVRPCDFLMPQDVHTESLEIHNNPSRAAGLASLQQLAGWPNGVVHQFRGEKVLILGGPGGLGVGMPTGQRWVLRITADFHAPVADVNGDRLADLVLLKSLRVPDNYPASYDFVPRVYVTREDRLEPDMDWSARGVTGLGPPKVHSEFSESLFDILLDGCLAPCKGKFGEEVCANAWPFPREVSFNALLADLTGDGLPDLIVAKRPLPGGTSPPHARRCVDGHDVFINRGYRWDKLPSGTEAFTSPDLLATPDVATLSAHPFSWLFNANRSCAEESNPTRPYGAVWGNPQWHQPPLAARTSSELRPLSMGAAAFEDINADGRVDVVIAYFRAYPKTLSGMKITSVAFTPRVHRVFLNTGRGFRDGTAQVKLPANLAFAVERGYGPPGAPFTADTARLTDVDGDGLADVVVAGATQAVGPSTRCLAPTTWFRNTSVVPDLMTSVTTGQGHHLDVEYTSLRPGDAAWRRGRPAPRGSQVVKRIRRSAGGPVETIGLAYENFVKDDETREAIGFEKVIVTFENATASDASAETVVTERKYDVRPTDPRAPGTRYPLRGLVLQTTVQSGNETRRTSSEPHVGPLGAAVWIRPGLDVSEQCVGSACVAVATHVEALDPFGNATSVRSGNFAMGQVLSDLEESEITAEFENRTDARWQLGLQRLASTRGHTRDGSGVPVTALLSEERWTYDATGHVATRARPAVADGQCLALTGLPADDVTTYVHGPEGLLREVTNNHGGHYKLTWSYSPPYLHPATARTEYTKHANGQSTGAGALEESYVHDLRHGDVVSKIDANGTVWSRKLDSLGRPVERRVNGALTSTAQYFDQTPRRVERRIFLDVSGQKSYRTTSHLDADGAEVALVEGEGTDITRRRFVERDAFGRTIKEYLPARAQDFSRPVAKPTEPFDAIEWDGFDRVTTKRTADGRTKVLQRAPRETTEILPRGNRVRTTLDGRGRTVGVEWMNDAGDVHASHSIERDGLGRAISFMDADGIRREIVLDRGGRPTLLSLPHAANAPANDLRLCHDLDDRPVVLVTAEGRMVSIVRDELGRPIVTLAETGGGAESAVRTEMTYDGVGSSLGVPHAAGRLSRIADDTGVRELGYDALGNVDRTTFAPTALINEGASSAISRISFELSYGLVGQLLRAAFSGTGAGVAFQTTLDYERDAMGRPVGVTRSGAEGSYTIARNGQHDEHGRLRSIELGNGGKSSWSYDTLSRLLVTIEYSGGARRSTLAYEHDANGNILTETRSLGAAQLSRKTHAYDHVDRLQSSHVATTTRAVDDAFTYSPGGNLLRVGSQAYSYGDGSLPQAVTEVEDDAGPSRRLSYNRDGQLVKDEIVDEVTGVDERILSYDASGCLRSMEVTRTVPPAPGAVLHEVIEARCGPDGSRLFQKRTDLLTGAVERVLFLGELAEVRPDDGSVTLRVPIGPSLIAEDVLSMSDGHRLQGEARYVQTDARGSLVATMSFTAPGLATAEAEFDAWGASVAVSSLPEPAHGFLGTPRERNTPYYALGRRLYDPTLRRWLSPDPLFVTKPSRDADDGRHLNLYAYARNNPATLLDPSGLDPIGTLDAFTILFWDGGDSLREGQLEEYRNAPLAGDLTLAAAFVATGATLVVVTLVAGEFLLGEALIETASEQVEKFSSPCTGPCGEPDKSVPQEGGDVVPDKSIEPYDRKKHYGRTPTAADRKAAGVGPDEVLDHDPPLVQRYYDGDPKTGEKPGKDMTDAERKASAGDRNRMKPQPRPDSNKQGGELRNWHAKKKKELSL